MIRYDQNLNPGAGGTASGADCDPQHDCSQFKPDASTVQAAIDAVRAASPNLTPEGFGGRGSNSQLGLAEVQTAIAFLQQCQRNKIPNLNSYALKHAAERWGRRNGMAAYVSNGELIAAGIFVGFEISEPQGLNVFIGVNRRSVQELDPECIWSTSWPGLRHGGRRL